MKPGLRFHYRAILLLFLSSLFISCSARAPRIAPPVAPVVAKTLDYHGETVVDNYFWLRERDNPAVLQYLQAENQYVQATMKHTESLQAALYKEMLGRIKETDQTVPEKIDEYYYYRRTEQGKAYPIYCRKKGDLNAAEEILLDQNALAANETFLDVGVIEVSPNHKLLAYSLDKDGSETFTIEIKNLETGEIYPERIPNTYYGVAWANDNKTLFYNVLDPAKRPYRVMRHELGSDPAKDAMVFEDKDQRFYVDVSRSKSDAYIFINSGSNTTTEIHFVSADHAWKDFERVQKRRPDIEYYLVHHLEHFYILTNDGAKRFRLMKVSVTDPLRENWVEVIPEREAITLEDLDIFENHLVVYERANGMKKVRIENLTNNKVHYIDFAEASYTLSEASNKEFQTAVLRFDYESLVTPTSTYDYDMETKERQLKKQKEVPGYDPSLYETERLQAPAADGTQVPISIVYKKGMSTNGLNPLWLNGYGAYGSPREPYFNSDRISLLDRGFIYAIAHIRGGGDLGREWYEQGKLNHKLNTFSDFIACAEYLIAQKYTSPGRLVISGTSAGGLLMGAVTNMRPDLFRVVVAHVPYVDAIHTMMDASIPLVVTEYEEWGNPGEKYYYDYMKTYSPYDNVRPQPYPSMLVTAGLNDPRVPFWEPAKWVAKLRANKTDKNLLLLKTEMKAGHFGGTGRYNELKETAFEYSFVLDQLRMNKQ